MKKINIILLASLGLFSACKDKVNNFKITFPEETIISKSEYHIDDDQLAKIDGIQSNDSSLIVFDAHSGNSYTLFDLITGRYIGRFGEIGQGPGEIPLGCIGQLNNDIYTVHLLSAGFIAQYSMDSLRININTKPTTSTKIQFQFGDVYLSKVIPINDSTFMGAGVYNGKYQYVLFNNKDQILDYSTEIYNTYDKNFNKYHKMISSEGTLRKSPSKNRFVYSLYYSDNLDILELVENKINIIKSIRDRDPLLEPKQNGTFVTAHPNLDCSIGYIDIAVGDSNIYALHSNQKVTSLYCSDIIRVFDWDGNPLKVYKLDQQAYFISINEKLNKLYAAIKNEEAGWSIVAYNL